MWWNFSVRLIRENSLFLHITRCKFQTFLLLRKDKKRWILHFFLSIFDLKWGPRDNHQKRLNFLQRIIWWSCTFLQLTRYQFQKLWFYPPKTTHPIINTLVYQRGTSNNDVIPSTISVLTISDQHLHFHLPPPNTSLHSSSIPTSCSY